MTIIKTLLLIDTDTGFSERFQRKLEVEDIADKYQVRMLKPDTTCSSSDMAKKVVSDTLYFSTKEDVCAIFVDIVIYESTPLDTDGILIARELRKIFPLMPIFNVSSKPNDAQQSHMDLFAEATLGDCDGVFPKSFLEGSTFSARRLALILKRGVEKRRCHMSAQPYHQLAIPIPQGISELFNINELDGRVAAQIEDIGPGAFWGLIQRLIPHATGVISYVAPGASGAYVFEANVKFKEPGKSAMGAKQFLIKIATTLDGLQKEAHNRRDLVKAPASREHFPSLLNEEPMSFGGLSGIAYEFEAGYETFLTYLARKLRGGNHHAGLGLKLVNILKNIYGDSAPDVKNVWHGCYNIEQPALIKLRGFLMENRQTLDERVGKEKVECVENFLMHGGETLRSLSKEMDIRHIHGDFNCGNILIDGSHEPELKISIIDLGSRRQDHVIKDVAKLERDIVFRVFDWDTLNYHDPNRISVWRQFLATLAPGAVFKTLPEGAIEDKGVLAAAQIIAELRSAINAIDSKGDEVNYRVALLHYSLFALLHPRISTAKKAFAVEYASSIINSLHT